MLGAFGNVCGGFTSDALVKRLGLKWGRRAVGLLGLGTAALFTVATILTTNKTATLFFLGLVQFILLDVSANTRDLLGYFSALELMGTLSRGIIDTRPIVLYLGLTVVMLTLTYQAFQSRKWRL